MAKKVAVILIKYNRPDLEAATIKSVLDTAEHPNYTLIAHQNEQGVSLSSVWNRLIDATDAEYICLLNTDTIPAAGWLRKLTDVLDGDDTIMAVVPSSNKVHMSEIWTPLGASPTQAQVNDFTRTYLRTMSLMDIETASAMCAVFRKTDQRFCEEFFLYGEDTEFFYRLSKLHGRVVWRTDAFVYHYGQQSMANAIADEGLDYAKLRERANELWLAKKAEIDEKVERGTH